MAGMMPTPASANSPTAYTILDVDQNAYLFVGGIIGTVKVCVCPSVCVRQRPQLVYPIVFISPCLLESRRSENNNIRWLHGGDILGR